MRAPILRLHRFGLAQSLARMLSRSKSVSGCRRSRPDRRRLGWLALLFASLLLSACATQRDAPEALLRARFHVEAASDGYASAAVLPVSGARIAVEPKAALSEFDYLAIDIVELEFGKCLVFALKPAAARDFFRLTVGKMGYRLVLTLNGQPAGARRLEGPITDGKVYIYVEADDARLAEIAQQLKETNIAIQKKLSKAT